MSDNTSQRTDGSLLDRDEPQPYRIINPVSDKPILIVCDHASRRFPAALGDMGLDPFARRCHLAIDIGAGALTERLAERLRATSVLCGYSRLVVDCNRDLLDPAAFLEYGDGIVVPGNRNLTSADKDARANAIYWPYHRAIDQQIERLKSVGPPPAFISMHSFTPVLNGVSRPWQIGVLWDKSPQFARIFLDECRAAGFHTGDNEPYSGKAPQDYTIDNHAEAIGLPAVGIEIRQDLIDNDAGRTEMADLMVSIVESIPERIGLTGSKISA